MSLIVVDCTRCIGLYGISLLSILYMQIEVAVGCAKMYKAINYFVLDFQIKCCIKRWDVAYKRQRDQLNEKLSLIIIATDKYALRLTTLNWTFCGGLTWYFFSSTPTNLKFFDFLSLAEMTSL